MFPPDPDLNAYDRSNLRYPPYTFPRACRLGVGQAIGDALTDWMRIPILALCVQSWHVHFVIPATNHPIEVVVKCVKDSVRWHLRPDRPIWARDYDKRFCFTVDAVLARIAYVERHNLADDLSPRPWGFIRDYHVPTSI